MAVSDYAYVYEEKRGQKAKGSIYEPWPFSPNLLVVDVCFELEDVLGYWFPRCLVDCTGRVLRNNEKLQAGEYYRLVPLTRRYF